jgi:hypothetical protein
MLESRCRCWSGRNVGGAERVARGSWRCGQVLSGRSRAGPWARADGAEVRRAEQRHAQEELRWKAVARDAGTRWPYRGRSSGVRRNADTRGAGEREGPTVGRVVKGARRRRVDVATVCRATVHRYGATRLRRTRVQHMRRKRSSEERTCVQQKHTQGSRGTTEAGSATTCLQTAWRPGFPSRV